MGKIDLETYDKFQVKLLKEECIIINEQDEKIGSASKMDCHLKSNGPPLHRAFSVFLFNKKNELLMQKRADSKILFPGHYTNTCCSHPLNVKSETAEDHAMGVKVAAQRRCWQELGISPQQLPIEDFQFVTRIHYKADSCKRWAENEIDYILLIKTRQDRLCFAACPEEISKVKWVAREQIKDFVRECRDNGVSTTPWFNLMLESGLLMKWWKHVDDLTPVFDTQTIHRF